MLSNCFDFCSAPILLFQRDEGRHLLIPSERTPHTNRIPQKVSLRSAKSLKFIRSSKNLLEGAQGPLSPRVSLKTIESGQRHLPSLHEPQNLEAFRNPFQDKLNNTGTHRTHPQIKVHFCNEPSFFIDQHPYRQQHRLEEGGIPLMHHALDDYSSSPSTSHASSVVFGAQPLSTITQEKQDLKSTHVSGNRLMAQGSMIKPKSVVSMLSSHSEMDSVLLERHTPLPSSERLHSLF